MKHAWALGVAFATSGLAGCDINNQPASGTYNVTSDCRGSTPTGTLQLPSFANLLDAATISGATAYGFPSESMVYTLGGELQSLGGQRSCVAETLVDGANQLMFACSEGGSIVCTIFLRQ